MEKNNQIIISTGTIVRVILAGLVVLGLFYLKDLILIILTAVVLASSAEPAIIWLGKKKIPRIGAAMITYLTVAIAFLTMFYFLVPPLLSESVQFLQRLPDNVRSIDFSGITDGSKILTSDFTTLGKEGGISSIISNVEQVSTTVSGGVFKATGAIFGSILSFILIVVISFYFAVQETGIDDFLKIITPVKYQDYAVSLWRRAQMKIGLWMQGQLLLGLIIGVLTYLGLMVIGLPYAFFLAIIAAVFELIPVFGPILSSIPAIVIGIIDGGYTMAMKTAAVYLIVHQFENHLIYPLVVRKVVGIPPVMVIIALIAGAKLAGFLGIILSVPISAAIKEYIDDVMRSKDRERALIGKN